MTSEDGSTGASKLAGSLISEVPGVLEPPPKDQGQMDPGQRDYRVYLFEEILDTSIRPVATVMIPRMSFSTSFPVGTEYWFNVSPIAPQQKLKVTWQDYGASDPFPTRNTGTMSFRMNQAAAWTSAATVVPASNSSIFVNNDIKVVIAWGLSWSSSTSRFTGQLHWFNNTGQNTIFNGAPPGGAILTANTLCDTRGTSWYQAVVPAF